MNRRTGLLSRLLVIGWIAGLVFLGSSTQAGGGGGPDLRAVFQNQQLHLPGGGRLPMTAVLGHRPVILQFLPLPCRACARADLLIRAQSFEYADQGVTVINIYGGSDQRALRAFRKEGWLGVPDLTDPRGTLARRAGVAGRHQLLFVSASGVVVSSLTGPFSAPTVLREIRTLIDF